MGDDSAEGKIEKLVFDRPVDDHGAGFGYVLRFLFPLAVTNSAWMLACALDRNVLWPPNLVLYCRRSSETRGVC